MILASNPLPYCLNAIAVVIAAMPVTAVAAALLAATARDDGPGPVAPRRRPAREHGRPEPIQRPAGPLARPLPSWRGPARAGPRQ
jgi:hypothetical protein